MLATLEDELRLLHINDWFSHVGGIESYLFSVSEHLNREGHTQAVVFGKGETTASMPSFRLPLLSSARLSDRRAIATEIKQVIAAYRPDLIHIHNIYNMGAIEACLDHGPTILHLHDFRYMCPASNFFFRRTQEICERKCSPACFALGLPKRCLTPRVPAAWWHYQRIRWFQANASRLACIVANSGYARDRMVQAGVPIEKIKVLPYFCPLEPDEAPPTSQASRTILFMGRIRDYKGIYQFIEAISYLESDVKGLIIGDMTPKRGSDILGYAHRFNCLDRLILKNWIARDEIRPLIRGVDVVTFPSIYAEAFGLVGVEALACGVPVVGFDVGGTREWLLDGHTGFSVPVKESRRLAEKTQLLLDDPKLRRRFGENGLALVRKKFSPRVHMRQLLEIYQAAIGITVQPEVGLVP